ncbi:MAG: hypothetical protein R3F37_04155 [Candidatus Competibacteraceae bacterium]
MAVVVWVKLIGRVAMVVRFHAVFVVVMTVFVRFCAVLMRMGMLMNMVMTVLMGVGM